MAYKISKVLEELGVDDYEILGNGAISFSKPSTIWSGEYDSITFCSKEIQNSIDVIKESKASVIIVDKDIDMKDFVFKDKAVVLVDNPREILVKVLNKCFPKEKKSGSVHPSSIIDNDAKIHPSVYISPKCVIGKCKIKANTVIHANVVINDCVTIGKNVIINPGCVIGYDGFGYYKDGKGHLKNFPHYGSVVIEDDVEIGSNTSIDRGALGNTLIKKGAKIDNLCHIAHNVVVGKNSMVIANAMVGGSTEIGDASWISPSAVLRDGIKIGNGALVGLGAVVIKDVPDDTVVIGNPAIPLEQFKEKQKILKNLKTEKID